MVGEVSGGHRNSPRVVLNTISTEIAFHEISGQLFGNGVQHHPDLIGEGAPKTHNTLVFPGLVYSYSLGYFVETGGRGIAGCIEFELYFMKYFTTFAAFVDQCRAMGW